MPRKYPIFLEKIQILDTAAEGKAIARYNNKVVFVPYAAPGDVMDINIVRRRKRFLEADIVKIHEFSPLRTTPFCSHFGICGGCKWQHLKYEAQLQQKQQQIKDHFERIAKVEVGEYLPILPASPQQYYRNKLEFTFSNSGWRTKEAMQSLSEEEKQEDYNVLGFHVPGFYDKIVDVEHCYLQADPSNEIRLFVKDLAQKQGLSFYSIRQHQGFVRSLIIRTTAEGEIMLIPVFKSDIPEKIQPFLDAIIAAFPTISSLYYYINPKTNDDYSDLEANHYHGKTHITEKMEDLSFHIGPKSFYQTNSKQAYALYKIVREFADLKGEEVVYDLYTGTGTIANFIANKAKKVLGIEYIEEAVSDAAQNAMLNAIENTHFLSGDMAKVLNDEVVEQFGAPDVIISDPPRAGMHPKVVEQILKIKPKRIVYISCNSSTQARDVAMLQENYKLVKSQAVDMFPHTHHVENVVLLEKK
jgi:23S rRNA (uracil1939-C5)-methyltransferase